MKMIGIVGAAILAAGFATAASASTTMTFDDPVTLSPTQAAGAWYTDRYAPAGFQSGVSFGGDNRLQETILASDAQPSAFYNTQGRKYDLASGTTEMSIDLYVDSSWDGAGNRMAGFWGTAVDGVGDVAAYPIIEFSDVGGVGSFQAWDDANGFIDMGLPTGFSFGAWYTMNITLSGGQFHYSVGDRTTSVDAHGAVAIGNVILQGYNRPSPRDTTIYWDNLSAGVPEPATWALMLAGFGLAGAAMRRRKPAVA